ncbi:hypothetical protein [Thermogymnomonas acidicola]|uniref:hypothetical protein n=1 Tax=Thermogymnomonas acidicola TaxID=399579 RepID=UPI0009464A15|nr:hypothetical protein [Thermogymnomonas acidicola]
MTYGYGGDRAGVLIKTDVPSIRITMAWNDSASYSMTSENLSIWLSGRYAGSLVFGVRNGTMWFVSPRGSWEAVGTRPPQDSLFSFSLLPYGTEDYLSVGPLNATVSGIFLDTAGNVTVEVGGPLLFNLHILHNRWKPEPQRRRGQWIPVQQRGKGEWPRPPV